MCHGSSPIFFALIAFSLELSHPLNKVIRTCELKMAARKIYRSVLGNYGPAAQPIRKRIGALRTGKLTQPYNNCTYYFLCSYLLVFSVFLCPCRNIYSQCLHTFLFIYGPISGEETLNDSNVVGVRDILLSFY